MEEPARRLAGPLPRALADEIALLLLAEGLAPVLTPAEGGVVVTIAAGEHARATRILAEEYPDGLERAARAATRPRPRCADPALGSGWFGRASWVLVPLIALSTGLYVAEELAGGSETRAVLLRFGATRPAHVRAGEWWRLVTALFVHIGPRHLLANLATLVVLGPALAAALGAGRFLFVYVLAGTAGNALSYLVTPSDVVSAGASGAILGVLGALGGHRIRFAASARYRGWQVVAALLAYLAIAVGAAPGVDTFAHLGGLAAGFALGLVVPPAPPVPSARERVAGALAGVVAAGLVLAAFAALVTAG